MPVSLNLGTLQQIFLAVTTLLGAFLAALWVSLVFWVARDFRARSADRLMRILAALIVLVLGPAGLAVYLVLRPPRTLDEVYQHTLEEEALLAQVEDKPVCPGCGGRTQPDWQLCPTCHTRLRKPCARCGRLMELPWKVCPACGTPAPGVRAENTLVEEDKPAQQARG
jgi:Double zinc ribbon